MQEVIRLFVRDLRGAIARSPDRKTIRSVVLIGSAARGDWVRGKSDVDLLVVVKNKGAKRRVAAFFEKELAALDRKHALRLAEACTDEKRYHASLLRAVARVESGFFVGVPFLVISEDEFDLLHAKAKERKLWFMMTFIGSLPAFLRNIGDTGRTIYGRDFIRRIPDLRLTAFDHIKLFFIPYYWLLLSFLSLQDRKLALNHAIKACLLEADTDVQMTGRHLGNYAYDERLYEKAFAALRSNRKHLRRCIDLRRMKRELPFTATVLFLFRSLAFLLTSHIYLFANKMRR